MAHVQGPNKRSDGSTYYEVRYRTPDRRHRTKRFDKKRDADRFANHTETDKDRGDWVDPVRSRTTLADWVAEWRPGVTDLRDSSAARLDATVDTHVLPAFGNRQLAKITNADVRAWVARMQGDGMSTSSLRKAVFALRRILAAAVADQRVTRNAADSVPLPGEQYGDQRFLTVDAVWSLAHAMAALTTRCHGPDATGERYRALVVVAAFGGLRFGELAALRRRHVDLLRGHVKVEDTLLDLSGNLSFGPTKTKNGKRTVPLPRRALAELSAHMDAYVGPDPDALVFTTAAGTPLRRSGFRRNWWMPAAKAAGLAGLRFHDMRHTFVSLAISAGANAKQVSMRAGHSSVAFTLDRYGHLYESADDQVTAAMDALIDRNDEAPKAQVVPLR